VPDRNGLTKAGRALQKHGNRDQSLFPRMQTKASIMNATGQGIVDDILTMPGSVIDVPYKRKYGRYFIEVWAPDGRGLRFELDGTLHGFLEPN
jgi:filamentous hemagglutinin